MDRKRLQVKAVQASGSGINNIKRRRINQDSLPLCQQCELLDLDKSFADAYTFYESARNGLVHRRPELYSETEESPFFYVDAFFVHAFGDRLSKPSDCELCRFFGSLRVQPDSHENHKLLAFCSSESSTFYPAVLKESKAWDHIRHTVFMAVVPDEPSYPPHGHDETWLEKEIPKEWLAFCRTHHGGACNSPDSVQPVAQGFRVIDCNSNPPEVIAVPWGTTYAALSYVWGRNPEDVINWPRTVMDAVAVTKELGLRYLWVDRLCINQSDPVEKSYLMSKMTDIYEAADFTIVAAAGSGAGRGLPGVRSAQGSDICPRQPQPRIKLRSGNVLVSALQDPRLDILKSEYWTRGWTYQEGVLSNRRLVFTESQAYWECRCMVIHESIDMPLPLIHEPPSADEASGLRMASYMLSGIFKGDSYSGGAWSNEKGLVVPSDDYRLEYGFPNHRKASVRAQLRSLNDHIRAFSSRKLSVETDSLAAFLGIVGMYKSTEHIYLYLGLPMWMDDILGDLTGAYISFALAVCSWYHRSPSEHSMFVTESCQRRTHLPSWTWAGWEGTVTWRAPPSDEHCVIMSDLIESERLHLVWAANIYLRSTCNPVCVRLLNLYSTEILEKETPTLLEIRDPLILKYTHRQETRGTWEWRRLTGRAGEQYHAERLSWDKQWYRIAGRLASVNMSISVTEKAWTEKHDSGEFISVLLFASQVPTIGHGRARFLTLRRVESTSFEARWERIGTLQLTIPKGTLDECMTNDQLLMKIPVRERRGAIVVQ
ncbi:hypothetical protein PT974_03585 [Cladobotryum mycophilum]|uniref:Heterokaryon incompatibility domain-containing protein n=1 Tax=Cladobotryum mycophilum TaxID=491253 RepID=A0ABR0SSQ7_9HYPO